MIRSFFSLVCLAAGGVTAVRAADGPDARDIKEVRDKAIAYLARAQSADGGFSSKSFAGPGVTALVTAALLRNGASPSDPVVARAIAYLEKIVKKDGGIYDKGL